MFCTKSSVLSLFVCSFFSQGTPCSLRCNSSALSNSACLALRQPSESYDANVFPLCASHFFINQPAMGLSPGRVSLTQLQGAATLALDYLYKFRLSSLLLAVSRCFWFSATFSFCSSALVASFSCFLSTSFLSPHWALSLSVLQEEVGCHINVVIWSS